MRTITLLFLLAFSRHWRRLSILPYEPNPFTTPCPLDKIYRRDHIRDTGTAIEYKLSSLARSHRNIIEHTK